MRRGPGRGISGPLQHLGCPRPPEVVPRDERWSPPVAVRAGAGLSLESGFARLRARVRGRRRQAHAMAGCGPAGPLDPLCPIWLPRPGQGRRETRCSCSSDSLCRRMLDLRRHRCRRQRRPRSLAAALAGPRRGRPRRTGPRRRGPLLLPENGRWWRPWDKGPSHQPRGPWHGESRKSPTGPVAGAAPRRSGPGAEREATARGRATRKRWSAGRWGARLQQWEALVPRDG
mmetsp:Transcript_309/g.1001  ORF Transcript_309/g.1001 Transcript_309/m.1001 type:complete len:230 (+) Transcript_309:461-1150(+)